MGDMSSVLTLLLPLPVATTLELPLLPGGAKGDCPLGPGVADLLPPPGFLLTLLASR